MVGLREGNDELACTLVAGVYVDASLLQSLRVHQGDQLEQQIGLDLEEIRSFPSDRRLEFLRVLAGDAVPGLGLTPVHYFNPAFVRTSVWKGPIRSYCS